MAKVTEYSKITKLKDNDIFLVDGPDGTRTILKKNAAKDLGGDIIAVTKSGSKDKVTLNLTDTPVDLATEKDLDEVADALLPIGTASGSPAIITDAKNGTAFKDLKVSIGPVQAGSGDPSPENVRAITGFTGVQVHRYGRDIHDASGDTPGVGIKSTWEIGDMASALITAAIDVSGLSQVFLRTFGPAAQTQSFPMRMISFNAGGTDIGHFTKTIYPGTTAVEAEVSLPQGTASVRVSIPIAWNMELHKDGAVVAIEFPSEAGTVGVGTLDVTAGILTVTHLFRQFDGTEAWELNTSGAYPFFFIPAGVTVKNSSEGWCSHFKWTRIRGADQNIGMDAVNGTSGKIIELRPGDSIAQTVEELTAWLANQATAGTPLQCAFPLGSPQIYTLTPTQIAALAGENVVWADCGPVEFTYVKDVKIQEMIAEESDRTASRAFTAGEYVILKDKLYKVVADISSGAELVPGTNIEETMVGDELNKVREETSEGISELKESLDDSGLSWNLIPENYPSGDEYETQGITFVKNADGTVSSSGIATAQARYYWAINLEVEPGTYMLGGVPEGASSRSFGFQYAITDGSATSSDYSLAQFGDIEITITAGKKLSIRSWYYTGYVDSGHTWAIYLGRKAGEYQSTKNPKYFIPIIYDNKEKAEAFENMKEPIQDLLDVTAKELKGNFELGSLDNSGRPYADQSTHQNRVMSSTFQTYPPKSILSISDGYRVAIHYYNTNSGASVDKSGWISAGKYEFLDYPFVKIVIARDPETAEEADVDTFTGAISYVSSLATADILDLRARLTKLEEGADTPLPEYWQTYLKTKAADVKNTVYNVGSHGIAFQFFTDTHLPLSDYRYYGYTLLPYILAYIKKNCFVPDAIFGGDALTNNPTSAEALEVLESYQIAFSNVGVYNIFGNHDNNPYGGSPAGSAMLTDDAVYSVLFRDMERKTDLESGGYWKLDYPNQKVRLIALNTHLAAADWLNDTTQVNWFISTLANTPAGYTVLVIPHLFFEAIIENGVATGVRISVAGERIKAFLDAFANRTSGQIKPNDDITYSYDFTGSQAKLAGVVAGHAHNDAYFMADAGYPMIAVVCDAVNGSYQQVARTRKTYTEHAYDVICLDAENQTINCIRIGSGEDRSFSYS